MTKLECPHCHDCLLIEEWNETNKAGIMLGLLEQEIPKGLVPDEWEQYREEHGGRMDCPSCGEVCIFEDINVY